MELVKRIGENLIVVFSKWYNIFIFFIITSLMGYIFIHFTNIDLISGNLGNMYLYSQLILQVLISILFGLFIPISSYKFLKFNSFSITENLSSGGGTLLGVLVAGCPACSITLASYLGLASLISVFPLYGLELKLLAVPMLVFANFSLLKDLNVCKIKKSKLKN